jgi:hypothetical protein
MAKGSGRLRQAFLVCLELAEAHYRGRGPQRRRGHPWVYGWDLYLALLLFRAYLKATYRHTVELYRELFPDRPCPSLKVPAPLRQGDRGGGALGPLRETQGAAPAPPPPGRGAAAHGQHGAGPP